MLPYVSIGREQPTTTALGRTDEVFLEALHTTDVMNNDIKSCLCLSPPTNYGLDSTLHLVTPAGTDRTMHLESGTPLVSPVPLHSYFYKRYITYLNAENNILNFPHHCSTSQVINERSVIIVWKSSKK